MSPEYATLAQLLPQLSAMSQEAVGWSDAGRLFVNIIPAAMPGYFHVYGIEDGEAQSTSTPISIELLEEYLAGQGWLDCAKWELYDCPPLTSLWDGITISYGGQEKRLDTRRGRMEVTFADNSVATIEGHRLLFAKGKGRRREPRTWIYFVKAGGFVKIGTSASPESRLNQLRSGNPEPFEMLAQVRGGRQLERELHARFASCRHQGEWFVLTDEILAVIRELVEQAQVSRQE